MRDRLVYGLLTLAVLALGVALRIADPALIAQQQLLVFDTYQRIKPRIYDPTLPVKIIDIDEESLAKIGQWPWPRSTTARLVTRLKDLGATVIAFDMIFPEPDRLSPAALLSQLPKDAALDALADKINALPTNDDVLARAMVEVPVVLGLIATSAPSTSEPPRPKFVVQMLGPNAQGFLPPFEGATGSLPVLRDGAAGQGVLNWTPRYDQVVRKVPLMVTVGGDIHPSLAAETLRLPQPGLGDTIVSAGAPGETSFGAFTGVARVVIGALEVPTDAQGQLWLHHTRHDERRYISAHKILAGEVEKTEIEGKVILVGTSAAGLQDTRTTPLEAAIPGVEIQAMAIEQMLLGQHLSRPDYMPGVEIASMIVLGLGLIWLVAWAGAVYGAMAGAVSVAASGIASWLAFDRGGLLIDPVYPMAVLTALYVVGTVERYLSTENDRNRVRQAFGQYLAPTLVEQLAKDPSRLKLGGEMRDVTILFCDVRNFTSISERLDAVGLTSFLNRLLTPLTDTILNSRGTIDKYMGDAIMAFWNAPLDDAAHARQAALAALTMLTDVERLNTVRSAEAQATGSDFYKIEIGIGLNTALCCVGNLGSERRFDYSVIGDGVNVASRLEGQSKTYGLPVITGEETARAAPDLAFLEIDLLAVKGRKEASRVFALLGGADVRHSPAFERQTRAHMSMLAAFRAREFDTALALVQKARAEPDFKLGKLYDIYEARIAAFKLTPPPADWSGSMAAETK